MSVSFFNPHTRINANTMHRFMRERKKYLPFLSVSVSPQAQEQLEEVKLEAVQDNNVELVTEILGDISGLKVKDDSAAELSRILKEPHFQVSRARMKCSCSWIEFQIIFG